MREQRLKEHPFCERCRKAWSFIAHHKRYPARDVDDYEALCEPCHKLEHEDN